MKHSRTYLFTHENSSKWENKTKQKHKYSQNSSNIGTLPFFFKHLNDGKWHFLPFLPWTSMVPHGRISPWWNTVWYSRAAPPGPWWVPTFQFCLRNLVSFMSSFSLVENTQPSSRRNENQLELLFQLSSQTTQGYFFSTFRNIDIETTSEGRNYTIGGGFKNCLIFTLTCLGKWSNLTNIFFNGLVQTPCQLVYLKDWHIKEETKWSVGLKIDSFSWIWKPTHIYTRTVHLNTLYSWVYQPPGKTNGWSLTIHPIGKRKFIWTKSHHCQVPAFNLRGCDLLDLFQNLPPWN